VRTILMAINYQPIFQTQLGTCDSQVVLRFECSSFRVYMKGPKSCLQDFSLQFRSSQIQPHNQPRSKTALPAPLNTSHNCYYSYYYSHFGRQFVA
jgi:hypothetical protein